MPAEFVQCLLARGSERTVTWLPEKVGKAGNTVVLIGSLKPWKVLETWGRSTDDKIVFRHKLTRAG